MNFRIFFTRKWAFRVDVFIRRRAVNGPVKNIGVGGRRGGDSFLKKDQALCAVSRVAVAVAASTV